MAGNLTDTTEKSWWALMSDKPFEEVQLVRTKQLNYHSVPHAPLTPVNKSPHLSHLRAEFPNHAQPCWSNLYTDNPSDELEAASFGDEPPIIPVPPTIRTGPIQPTIITSSDSNNQHEPQPMSEPMLGNAKSPAQKRKKKKNLIDIEETEFDEETGTTTSILDMLEKKVCSFHTGHSPTLKKLEENLTLQKLEEQLQKMNHPSLWNILGDQYTCTPKGDFYEYSESDEEETDEYSTDPPSPVASNGDSTDDIFVELENDVAYFRERLETPTASQKYKELLRGSVVTPSTVKAASATNIISERPPRVEAPKVKPLKPANAEQPVATGGSTKPVSQAPRSVQSSRLGRDKVDTGTRSLADNENIGSVFTGIESRSSGVQQILKDMSSLTEDRTFTMGISDFGGDHSPPKTCLAVPELVQKRLLKLKGRFKSGSGGSVHTNSSFPSTESFPVMKMMVTHEDGEDRDSIVYVYDYESKSQAYVAYFRRGATASECVRLYEHPSPPSYSTLNSEVVVKVDFSTVSTTDCAVRKGDWWNESSRNALNLPVVPGVAFVGRVEDIDRSIGAQSGLHKGDRVISLVRVGANSRYRFIGYDRLVKVPPGLVDVAAVTCIPEIYLSAFQCLHLGQKNAARYRKSSLSDKSILVLHGVSVLGRATIELARAAGASNVYATGRERDFDSITKCGGLPLSRDPRHWLSVLAGKMDIVISPDHPYVKPELRYDHIQTLNKNGKLILIGGPEEDGPNVIDLHLIDDRSMGTNRKLHHYNVFDSWEFDMKQGRRDLTYLLKLLGDGLVSPIILDRIPLSKVAKAQELLENKHLNGFVLCEPWIKARKRGSMLTAIATAKMFPTDTHTIRTSTSTTDESTVFTSMTTKYDL